MDVKVGLRSGTPGAKKAELAGLEVLQVSRTGCMAMRRGQHSGRVMKAQGTSAGMRDGIHSAQAEALASEEDEELDPDALPKEEALLNQFDEHDI